jgi:hypothetical protein
MLADVEDGEDGPLRQAEPATRPTKGWLRRKIEKISKAQNVTLSATAKRRAMSELDRVVIATTGDPRIAECRQVHQSLSLEFVSL